MKCLEVARNVRFCGGAEEYMKRIAELEQQLAESQREVERLRVNIDCACNALTDAICVSGNNESTNMYFVRKLRNSIKPPAAPPGEPETTDPEQASHNQAESGKT